MATFATPIPMRRVQQGQQPSASGWNTIVENIERLQSPKQKDEPAGRRAEDPEVSEEEAEATEPAGDATTTTTTWTEQARVTSSIDVDGTEIDRIDQMTMRDESGNVEIWIFNNPPV